MPAPPSRRLRAQLLGLVGAAAAFIPGTAWAVSAGCAQVNSGAWDQRLQSFSIGATLTSFDNGDQLNFTVSGRGELALLASSGGSFVSVLIVNTPGSGSFTITATYTTFRPLNDAVPGPLNVTATCTPAPNPPQPAPEPEPKDASHSKEVTRAFLASRVNGILLNDPSATSLLNRPSPTQTLQSASAGTGTTTVASNAALFANAMRLGSDSPEGLQGSGKAVQFSQSLSQLRRDAAKTRMERERMALGAGDGEALPLAYESTSPWDVWVEGRYSAFDEDNANLDRKGYVGVLYFGGDLRLAENTIVGVLAQFDWAKDDSDVFTSKVDGNGWMIGPYLSARIHQSIYFDARAAWGQSSNSYSHSNTETTADFDTTRWLVKGTLAGNWVYDPWRFTPTAELAYVEESADAFTNSAGTFVPGQDVSLGRLQFGPEVGYRFAHTADTFVEPFAAIKGVWDFDNPNVAIVDGYVVGPGDFWGRLEGGLNVITSSGWYVRGLASWDGVGASDYSGYTLQGTVNVPLN